MRSKTRWFVSLSLAAVLLLPAAFGWWALRPIALAQAPLEVSVRVGSTARSAAQQVHAQGAALSPGLFALLARLGGDATRLQAGNYLIDAGTSPWQLLRRMVRGGGRLLSVTVPEGWTYARVLATLEHAPGLVDDVAGLDGVQIMQRIGAPPGLQPEGWFFPDTYMYAPGSSASALLARGYHAMRRKLEQAWAQRAPGLPLSDPEQALTLASIVERETGRAEDRARVASVFVNRLRVGMPLQSDPTVIYALGPRYDGRLHRSDMSVDSPYNTYVHPGLPPTPIALPGVAALDATLHPAPGRALYFVARGDGSSAFSNTLREHDAAIQRYMIKRQPAP